MDMNPNQLNDAVGGFGWAAIWALVGRLLAHAHMVQSGHRKIFSITLVWEIPVVIGMARVGQAAADLAGASPGNLRDAVILTVAYLGPRIFERAFEIVSQRLGYKKP